MVRAVIHLCVEIEKHWFMNEKISLIYIFENTKKKYLKKKSDNRFSENQDKNDMEIN